MITAKLFANGGSQAVRLPKECRFAGNEVCVKRIGDIVVLYAPRSDWSLLLESLDEFTEDFMAERNQPARAEVREEL